MSCSFSAKAFRQEQCEARNGYQSDPKGVKTFVEWVPKYAGVLPGDVCKLTCRAKGTGYYVVFSQKVKKLTLHACKIFTFLKFYAKNVHK